MERCTHKHTHTLAVGMGRIHGKVVVNHSTTTSATNISLRKSAIDMNAKYILY